jgi:uncharacterized protein
MKPDRFVALLSLLLVLRADVAQGQVVDTVRLAVEPQVELLTIIHLPAGEGPHPVVLLRNPYRTRGGAMGWLAERLVPYGYAVVEQDVRGTGGSDGAFIPFRFDVQDGTATLDWLAARPWAGAVGLWGISYLGWAAYALAETGHPAVSALAVGSAWAEMEPFLSPGGAFHLMAHLTWLMGFGGGGGLPSSQPALDSLFRTLPLAPLLQRASDAMGVSEQAYRWHAVDVPALHFTGWYDYIYRDALRGYDALRAAQGAGARQRLIVGAWAHNGELSGATRVGDVDFGPAAAAGMDSVAAWARRFFDVHLRGLPETDAPVRVFVMGENGWRAFADWPPPAAVSSSWYLAPDGRLESRASRRAGATAFRYDPENPMPTLGGANSHFFPRNLGPLDQTPLDGRDDVATFLSPPLGRPLVVTGPLRAVLYLEADAPSTDVAVKLIVVAQDGTARLIEDGIRRVLRLERGVNVVTVEMGQRALRLEPGTRLRLDVTGGNFPKYDRNPNTGEDPLTAASLRPVTITLHHGRARPSRLELVTLVE